MSGCSGRATLWGGFMTGNDLGETLIGRSLVFQDSGFLGAGFSRTLAGGNSIKLEGEIQGSSTYRANRIISKERQRSVCDGKCLRVSVLQPLVYTAMQTEAVMPI